MVENIKFNNPLETETTDESKEVCVAKKNMGEK